jgi:hypothetical protein
MRVRKLVHYEKNVTHRAKKKERGKERKDYREFLFALYFMTGWLAD